MPERGRTSARASSPRRATCDQSHPPMLGASRRPRPLPAMARGTQRRWRPSSLLRSSRCVTSAPGLRHAAQRARAALPHAPLRVWFARPCGLMHHARSDARAGAGGAERERCTAGGGSAWGEERARRPAKGAWRWRGVRALDDAPARGHTRLLRVPLFPGTPQRRQRTRPQAQPYAVRGQR